jgi:uncharacterized membrane-anchored protein
MRNRNLLLAALLLCSTTLSVTQLAATPILPNEQALVAKRQLALDALQASLHPQYGKVSIPGAKAALNLGDAYYFLSAAEAKRVLNEGWGNPPDALGSVLGMVLPKGKTFTDKTWGAVVQYDDTGHIDDKDAAGEDYDSVLTDLKSGEEESNKAEREAGYPGSLTIGWAQAPTYDKNSRTLIWARNIKFEGEPENTLNYDVRTLGREGTLSLNMVDSMANLGAVRTAAEKLGKTVEFLPGQAYADFNPDTDKLADYGLAGLVAGGVGLAVAKKAGMLALLLIFLKKGFVFILIGLAASWKWIARKLGLRKDEEVEQWGDEGRPDASLDEPPGDDGHR